METRAREVKRGRKKGGGGGLKMKRKRRKDVKRGIRGKKRRVTMEGKREQEEKGTT